MGQEEHKCIFEMELKVEYDQKFKDLPYRRDYRPVST